MSEHNTQLPTGGMLCGKSKWEVRRRWSYFYGDYSWEILDPDGLLSGDFNTWREAMDYADRKARTVKVRLPRLSPTARDLLSQRQLMPYAPDHAETLALALLALHYQQEVGE